ncbi:WUSCHEL-related homeobox 12 [Sesamum alatum]|uniref:Protein WUSCHEL n=1 Tax=Sesamum alatum TaxID=300844 RepID=A0AAE1XJR4_9LAMI|nr:WUSCHEL-related homeobox 12 [Sesamum alatum]
MEDQEQEMGPRASHGPEADQRSEPVRSRWTPKPEQILILESIFNSGMVNPPKDETVRIRKMLEKFGAVGDANVFYWFQNRRSRSRRRQRQIQASLSAAGDQQPQARGGGGAIQYENTMIPGGFLPLSTTYPMSTTSSCLQVGSGSSSSFGPAGNDGTTCTDFFSFSGHPGGGGLQELEQNTLFGPPETSSLHNYQSGEMITVFINGVATEVGRGPVDMKAMFGGDLVLFHSSGVPVEVNEFGFVVQSLQHGESYFLEK